MNDKDDKDIQMSFSEFAAILYPVLGGGMRVDEFTKQLFYKITNFEADENPIDDLTFQSFKAYYHGINNISRIAKKINGYVDTYQFDEFLHSYSETVLENLGDALEAALGIQFMSSTELVEQCTNIFRNIISEACTTKRKATKAKKTVMPLTALTPSENDSRIIPSKLTDKNFVSTSQVLHREEMINKVSSELQSRRPDGIVQKTNILITGFGGWGKTTVARVVYSMMLNSGCYYSVGWIDYNIDLRNSFLNANAVKLFEDELDQDKRWTAIKKELLDKGSPQKKILLFVDNVDQKSNLNQFPKNDSDLQLFADASNINLVLTSRLAAPIKAESLDIQKIPALSTEQCIDLFYHFWEEKRRTEDIANIKKLIAMAHQHTLAIKLLAQGAKLHQLDKYVEDTEKVGFNFVIPEDDDDIIAATELKKLFDLKTRTEKQLHVLWDFSVLPQTTLDLKEAESLLGFQVRDLKPLVDEGWLNYENGFSLHPLIKTVIHLNLEYGKAPAGTMSHLFNLVANNILIFQTDSYIKILRKLSIVENALLFCDAEGDLVQFYYNLGKAEYEHARKRLTSLHYLGKAREECSRLPDRNIAMLAEINYQIGYIESTTQKFRQRAYVDLEKALSQWESLGGHEYEVDKAKDHLGYVLSDSADTQEYARRLLSEAYESREERYKREKKRTNASDYATTCDNLACLLMKCSPDEKKTIQRLLSTAYNIRCKIYNRYGDNETEVAWTAFNIGDFLGNICNRNDEAEKYLRHALVIRREQDKKKPGAFTANIVFTLVALANVIKHDETRSEEVKALLEEASLLQKGIDHEHSGFFLTPDGKTTESIQKDDQKDNARESKELLSKS